MSRSSPVAGSVSSVSAPRCGFLERDLEVVTQIGATLRSAATPGAEQIAEPEHVAEDVGEIAEVSGSKPAPAPAAALTPA